MMLKKSTGKNENAFRDTIQRLEMIMYGAMQGECVDDVNDVNKSYKPLFDKKEYHKLA